MYDLLHMPAPAHEPAGPAQGRVTQCEARRLPDEPGRQAASATPWLALMLDEVDNGMLLLGDDCAVLHANHAARCELDADHPLQVLGGELRAAHTQDLLPLRNALHDAHQRGLRSLIRLGEGEHRVGVAVVPLARAANDATPYPALLVLGKRQVCGALSAQWFARNHGLTPAETRVLAALCEGQPPSAIAAAQGVALSTVRSQIGSIRGKTGAASIRALVHQVVVLPPLVGALRRLPVLQ
jgi:DNA-binding CsgD family transcriptional regulator